MTGYANFQAKESKVEILVEQSSLSNKNLVAYIALDDDRGNLASEWLNLEEAELVHSALGTLIEEYKARQPTNVQLIEAFPVGTRFTVRSDFSDSEPAHWVRTFRGISGESTNHARLNELSDWNKFIVEKIEETN